MSDFHRSLDRALENLQINPDAPVRWRNPCPVTLRATQERIDEAVKQAAIVSNAFAVRRDPAYDDSYLRDTSILDWYDRIDCMGTE